MARFMDFLEACRGFFRYSCSVMGMAWKHALTPAQDIIFVLVILAGILGAWVPRVDLNAWQAAAIILSTIVGVRLLLAPYWLYNEQKLRADQLEARLADKRNRNQIAKLLSVAMMEGRDLMARYTDRPPAPADKEPDDWLRRTETLIRKELGPIHFARFNTPDDPPVQQVEDPSHNRAWNGIRYRVLNLKKFIEELGPQQDAEHAN
jgi:hypothetical protein